MPGSAGTERARPAASTTGVSRTTVASRLSTAVTTAASAKTPVNSSAGFPPLQRPDALRGGGEEPRPGADVGDHEDRHQERHHRRQAGEGCAHLGRGQQPGRQRDAGAGQADECLDPSRRVHERHGQHAAEGEHDDDVRGGWHAAQPRCTCEDGRGCRAGSQEEDVGERAARPLPAVALRHGRRPARDGAGDPRLRGVPRLHPDRPRGEAGPRGLPRRGAVRPAERRRPGLPGDPAERLVRHERRLHAGQAARRSGSRC